jgi:hypothetical protein
MKIWTWRAAGFVLCAGLSFLVRAYGSPSLQSCYFGAAIGAIVGAWGYEIYQKRKGPKRFLASARGYIEQAIGSQGTGFVTWCIYSPVPMLGVEVDLDLVRAIVAEQSQGDGYEAIVLKPDFPGNTRWLVIVVASAHFMKHGGHDDSHGNYERIKVAVVRLADALMTQLDMHNIAIRFGDKVWLEDISSLRRRAQPQHSQA